MIRIPSAWLGLALATLSLPACADPSPATTADSCRLYFLAPLVSRALPQPGVAVPLAGLPVTQALRGLHLSEIRRGVAHTSDISSGAFQRGDVEVLIDGERHPAACPNRMDNPLTRINPSDMSELDWSRGCCAASCGLGGVLNARRRTPGRASGVDLDLQTSALATRESSLALGIEGGGVRLSSRALIGAGYEDGQGRPYQELYPYAGEPDYQAGEAALDAHRGDWSAGGSWSRNENLPFPYLQMDERSTTHVAARLGWRGHKVYWNRTSHLMDDGLRTLNGLPMASPLMVSEARNQVVGLTGRLAGAAYHLSWTRWSLDNHFNTPAGRLENHMLPDLSQLGLEAQRVFELSGPLSLSARLALLHDQAGDGPWVDATVGRLRADPAHARTFLLHGLGLQWRLAAGKLHGAVLLESAGDDPGLESLWMSLRKPAGKPWWLGDPDLPTALRHTLRGSLERGPWSAELALSRVSNWAAVAKSSFALSDSTRQSVQTWHAIDADLLEAGLGFQWRGLASRASFAWGRDVEAEQPLAEIAPLQVVTSLERGLRPLAGRVWLRHTWTAPQRRVSSALDERPSAAWNRVDLGLEATWRGQRLALELDNALDHDYADHLAYARSPFSAGLSVLDPGRTLRLRLSLARPPAGA